MNDDRFKDAGHFEPRTAWEKITRANKDRAFEAKYPTKWWHGPYFTLWAGGALLLLVASVAGLLIWAFSGPYA